MRKERYVRKQINPNQRKCFVANWRNISQEKKTGKAEEAGMLWNQEMFTSKEVHNVYIIQTLLKQYKEGRIRKKYLFCESPLVENKVLKTKYIHMWSCTKKGTLIAKLEEILEMNVLEIVWSFEGKLSGTLLVITISSLFVPLWSHKETILAP